MRIPLKPANPARTISLAIFLLLAIGTVEGTQLDGAHQQAEIAHSTQCLPGTAFDSGFTGVPLLIDCITPARAEAALILDGTLGDYDRYLIQQCLHNSGFNTAGADDGLFDHQTRQALYQWQARHGYPQTGYITDIYQQAMLTDCLTPARMVQAAQTTWTDSPGQWLAKSQVASAAAAQGLSGWFIALYTGLGVIGAAAIFGGGGDDPAPAPPAPPVLPPEPPPAVPPVFASSIYTLEILDTDTGDIGEAVTATHPTGAFLTYSLSDPDAAVFSIDANSGQLSVAPGATLDASKSSYMFSVIATSPAGLTATRAVTITVVTGVHRDWEALKAFYHATNGADWTTNTGWAAGVAASQAPTATELDAWHGVTVTDGRVTEAVP